MTKSIDSADASGSNVPREEGAVFALAIALAALAGFVDATGYIHFHQLFVSFMSGNSTQAMVAAAHRNLPSLVVLLRTIALFVVGVALGEILYAAAPRWGRPIVLLCETLLLSLSLAAARSAWSEDWIASALTLAMGLQNAAVHKAEGISVALTYVTGTLVHVGRGIAKALRGTASWRAVLPFVGLWIGLACGGVAGAFAALRSLPLALSIAIGASVLLLLWAFAIALMATEPEAG